MSHKIFVCILQEDTLREYVKINRRNIHIERLLQKWITESILQPEDKYFRTNKDIFVCHNFSAHLADIIIENEDIYYYQTTLPIIDKQEIDF